MGHGTEEIEQYFAECFAHWGIRLSDDVVAGRRAGHLFEHGWHIGFFWGAEAGEEFLEFLAQHRMTSDRHTRVYASGRVEDLETAPQFTVIPRDATPEEADAAVEASAREHRRVSAELREKGLLPPQGENLPALDVNEYLRSGGRNS